MVGVLPARSDPVLSFSDWADFLTQFTHNGINYTLPGAKQEDIAGNFTQMSRGAYKASVVVFACMDVRAKLFSDAVFAFRRRRNGRPAGLFTSGALDVLQRPWPGGTTGDLLYRMEQYASLAGNAFVARTAIPGFGSALTCLRPDWVTIIAGSRREDATAWDVDAEVLGYIYEPGGPGSGKPAVTFLPETVAHYAPVPDPEARFRGMSWVTPVIREVMADKAATDHKLSFFENGATVNLALKFPVEDLEMYRQWINAFKQEHEGRGNAYKTLFLGGGADATVVGADFRQMDFKITQGAGETRIAAAGGVPPVIVGLSEGLAAATYSNYGQARRRFADQTMRPLWRNAAGSLARIIDVPADAELWYDDRDIAALREDQKDVAEALQMKAVAMKTLVDAGYDPDSVRDAVDADDLTTLTHTGLVSVQLQEPGADQPSTDGENQGTPPGT
jgi:phage portal protein BeeE